jgi:hemolysin III
VAVYGLALVATFTASACYHLMPWDHVRPTLRRLDHAAIFLKIAGTCTPMAALVGTAFAWTVLAAVWALALLGAGAKAPVLARTRPARARGLPRAGLARRAAAVAPGRPAAGLGPGLAAAGGLLYTFGVVFFAWESLRFSTAIWHGFVLAASGCCFAAIAMGSFAA